MNKNGFTLVELLAVIAIMGVITTIAVVSLTGVRNKVDIKLVEANLDLVLIAAKGYGDIDLNGLSTKKSTTLTVKELKKYTSLDIDKSYYDLEIKIYLDDNRANACVIEKSAVSLVGKEQIGELKDYLCEEKKIISKEIIKVDNNLVKKKIN